MTEAFHQAIAREIVWKNDEMRRFAVELVRRAVESPAPFTTDLVPDAARGDGHGIAGSVVELLKVANVIEPVGILQGGKWYPERQKSTRPGCKARYLCVHQLKSLAIAREFLRRHACESAQEQFVEQELVL